MNFWFSTILLDEYLTQFRKVIMENVNFNVNKKKFVACNFLVKNKNYAAIEGHLAP